EEELSHLLKVPYDMMAWLLGKLERDDIAEVNAIPDNVLSSEHRERYGLSTALCMALRSGSEIIGIQVAYRRRSGHGFTATDFRIARGVAQSASLALNHAKLVEELERANRVRSEFVA